jgi:hypothetical protein
MQWTCARLIEEIRIGMKPFVAVADDECARGGDIADRSVVDEPATCLEAYMDPARLQRVWQKLVPRSQLLTYIRLPDAA